MTWKCKRCEYQAKDIIDMPMHLIDHGFPLLYPHDALRQFRHMRFVLAEESREFTL